jgi:starch synthase
MAEILHVSPVMPVDEHHIEYALDRAGHSGALVTSWVPTALEHGLFRLLPFFRRRMRREPVRLRQRDVCRHTWPDMRHFFDQALAAYSSVLLAHDDFFSRVDRRAAARIDKKTGAVVGREFGCLQTFRRASALGIPRVYHLPTVHHQALKGILELENEAYPGVCRSTFDTGEFEKHRLDNKLEELELSDLIVCPSNFVRGTMLEAGVPEKKIRVIPFGCESSWLSENRKASRKTFLFAGNISARKGAHRLIQVWKQLEAYKTHRLLMVGDMHLSPTFLKDYKGVFEHIPRMPREDLRELYLSADAFVLPALAEGFALVILEALSCGTPVIASRNSGAEGFLADGDTALLHDAQDNESLLRVLERALTQPDELRAIGERGRAKALAWPWRLFEEKIMAAISSVLHDEGPNASVK